MAFDESGVPFRVDHADDISAAIIADMLGLTDKISDFNPGSIVRTLSEAFSIQIEEFNYKEFYGILRAIPAILYEAFDFPLRRAVYATGRVTFTRSSINTEETIAAGLVLGVGSDLAANTYVTIEDLIIPIGVGSASVGVRSSNPGISGNTAAGTIVEFVSFRPSSVASVTNNAAIINGKEAETESSREVRFREYVSNLARAQVKGIEAGARSVKLTDDGGNILEAVDSVVAYDHPYILARVQVFIDNGGATATQDLIDEVQRTIDGYKDVLGNRIAGYKSAGIMVDVAAIDVQPVNVAASFSLVPGYSFDSVVVQANRAISDFLTSLGPFTNMLLNELVCVISEVPGVSEVIITSPTSSVTADQGSRILPGTITLSLL